MLALTLVLHLAFPAAPRMDVVAPTLPNLRVQQQSKFRIEPNMGRYAEEVRYVMFTDSGVTLFTDDGMVDSSGVGVVLKNSAAGPFNALGFRYAVRNTVRSDGPLYLPLYSKLVRRGIYPGIDAIYEMTVDGSLEVSFLLQPAAKLSDIVIAYQGVEKIEQSKKGELTVKTITGKIVQRQPRILRMMGGRYMPLPVAMRLFSDGFVRFQGQVSGD
jgi:hypothetical protein